MSEGELIDIETFTTINKLDLHNTIKYAEILSKFHNDFNRLHIRYQCITEFLRIINPMKPPKFIVEWQWNEKTINFLNAIITLGKQSKKHILRPDIFISKEDSIVFLENYRHMASVVEDYIVNANKYFLRYMRYEYTFTEESLIFEDDGVIYNLTYKDGKFIGTYFKMDTIQDGHYLGYIFKSKYRLEHTSLGGGILSDYIKEFHPDELI